MVQNYQFKPTFKPYSQKGGTCGGFAIANALRHLHGIDIVESEIYRLYKDYDIDGREGIRTVDLLNILKKQSLGGLVLREWHELYNVHNAKNRNTGVLIGRIRVELLDPEQALIFGFKLCGKGKPIPLLHNVYKTNEDTSGDFHIVYVEGLWGNEGIKLQNSWGTAFGENGSFYMEWEDVLKRADSIFTIR